MLILFLTTSRILTLTRLSALLTSSTLLAFLPHVSLLSSQGSPISAHKLVLCQHIMLSYVLVPLPEPIASWWKSPSTQLVLSLKVLQTWQALLPISRSTTVFEDFIALSFWSTLPASQGLLPKKHNSVVCRVTSLTEVAFLSPEQYVSKLLLTLCLIQPLKKLMI